MVWTQNKFFPVYLVNQKHYGMVINYAGNMNAPNIVKVTFFNGPNYIASMDDSKTDEANFISQKLTDVSLRYKNNSLF